MFLFVDSLEDLVSSFRVYVVARAAAFARSLKSNSGKLLSLPAAGRVLVKPMFAYKFFSDCIGFSGGRALPLLLF